MLYTIYSKNQRIHQHAEKSHEMRRIIAVTSKVLESEKIQKEKIFMIASNVALVDICVAVQKYFMAVKNACCSTVLIFELSILENSAYRTCS